MSLRECEFEDASVTRSEMLVRQGAGTNAEPEKANANRRRLVDSRWRHAIDAVGKKTGDWFHRRCVR
jgi:hypothetical protein